MQPFREGSSGIEQFLEKPCAVGTQLVRLACSGLDRRAQIFRGSLVSQQHAQQTLDLKDRRSGFGAQPVLERQRGPPG